MSTALQRLQIKLAKNIHESFPDAAQECSPIDAAGRRGQLCLRSSRIFKHVKGVLQLTKVESGIGNDYANVLRTHLLVEPLYCSRASPYIFQGAGHHLVL